MSSPVYSTFPTSLINITVRHHIYVRQGETARAVGHFWYIYIQHSEVASCARVREATQTSADGSLCLAFDGIRNWILSRCRVDGNTIYESLLPWGVPSRRNISHRGYIAGRTDTDPVQLTYFPQNAVVSVRGFCASVLLKMI